MRVYLFGAGASYCYDKSPTGVRPPLARNFFDVYNRLPISSDRYVLVGNIVNYVRETRAVDPFHFAGWNENIENFLSEIDDLIRDPEAAGRLPIEELFVYSRVYDEMVFLFTSVLNEIQNGPPCPNYSKLVSALQPGDVLVTFNWDALVDRALWESGGWFPADGYGLRFSGLFDDGWRQGAITDQPSKHRLLKLHGSTNWLMPYLTMDFRTRARTLTNYAASLDDRPLYCFVKATTTYETYLNRARAGYAPFSYYYYPPDIPIAPFPKSDHILIGAVSAYDLPEHGTIVRGGFPRASMPLLVAPVKRKRYDVLGGVLEQVWEQAEKAIAACDDLIVVGYSFPPTDTRAWRLIVNGVSASSRRVTITLVNPHPGDIRQRLAAAVGSLADVDVIQAGFDEFVRDVS